jgi:hypothetical protein
LQRAIDVRGDIALTCNSTGNDYDELSCQRGCDPASNGCHLCDPNQTTCTNGEVATCDANGDVTSMVACPLGCFEGQPCCRDIDPSNNLGMYLDMVADPPDVDLTDAVLDTKTGTVTNGDGTPVEVPNFLVQPAPGGVPIRVFVVNTLHLQGGMAETMASTNADLTAVTDTAFALLARGDVTIAGSFKADARAGGVAPAACVGGMGRYVGVEDQGGNPSETRPRVAAVVDTRPVEAPAEISPGSLLAEPADCHREASLVPLRGGCPGGADTDGVNPTSPYGGPGGGAVQLSSRTKIEIDGVIDVRGRTATTTSSTSEG